MRSLKKINIFLILSICCISVKAGNSPVINLSANINKSSSPSSFILNYNINFQNIDPADYISQEISYPDEFFIAEGYVKNGIIAEKDFLNSEQDIDLNGDGDTSDTFILASKAGSFSIAGKPITPIYKKTNSGLLLIPSDTNRIENIVKMASNGTAFTVHKINISTGKLTAGIARKGGNVVFKKYPNSLLVIEIIQSINNPEKTGITINNSAVSEGFTNETALSASGEPLYRYSYMTQVDIKSGQGKGTLKIEKLTGSFTARIKYCFAISDRIIIISEKFLQP